MCRTDITSLTPGSGVASITTHECVTYSQPTTTDSSGAVLKCKSRFCSENLSTSASPVWSLPVNLAPLTVPSIPVTSGNNLDRKAKPLRVGQVSLAPNQLLAILSRSVLVQSLFQIFKFLLGAVSHRSVLIMLVTTSYQLPGWEQRALEKKQETWAKLDAWRLEDDVLERAKSVRNLTGDFIEGLLSIEDCQITRLCSQQVVNSIREGVFTTKQVASAYYKRAAISHQLVSD